MQDYGATTYHSMGDGIVSRLEQAGFYSANKSVFYPGDPVSIPGRFVFACYS